MFSREIEIGERIVEINQIECGDTGVVVWDSAIVLAKYLGLIADKISGKTAIELGSGTGAVGLCASALGANVIITDLEENMEIMNHNIKANQGVISDDIEALILKWGDKSVIKNLKLERRNDFIFVADCVYYKESLVELVYTLKELSDANTEILLSYEDRDSPVKIELQKMFKELMLKYFTMQEIPLEKQDEEFRSPDIHILSFRPI